MQCQLLLLSIGMSQWNNDLQLCIAAAGVSREGPAMLSNITFAMWNSQKRWISCVVNSVRPSSNAFVNRQCDWVAELTYLEPNLALPVVA